MRLWSALLGLAAAVALGAAALIGVRGLRPPSPDPAAAIDVPSPVAERELCAARIEADGREAAAGLASGDEGASFALRNDRFRVAWHIQALQSGDATRDWQARIDALAARMSSEARATPPADAYGRCLQAQSQDPAFTAALHAYLPYVDAR